MTEEASVARQGAKAPWVRWVAIGCVVVVILAAVLAAGVTWVAFSALRRAEAVQLALETARSHPAAREALGEPIEAGWLIGGSISVTGPSGEAELSIPVAGPRGEGRLFAEAEKRAGRWELVLLELAPEAGQRVDLLAPAARDR